MVHCSILNNDYQEDLRLLYTFVPSRSFGQSLENSPKNFIFLKAFNSEPLETENKINIIKVWLKCKMRYSFQPRDWIFLKGYGLLPFAKKSKSISKNISKNVSLKYNQKRLNHAKQSSADALKISLEKAIQKTTDVNGDLTGKKIADKITKKVSKNLSQNNSATVANKQNKEISKKKDIFLQMKDRKLLMIWDQYNSITMEYQKTLMNLLNNASNQPTIFNTKSLVETNDDARVL